MNWSAFLGAFLGTLINLLEIGLLLKIIKCIQKNTKDTGRMLKEFKLEGQDGKWLK